MLHHSSSDLGGVSQFSAASMEPIRHDIEHQLEVIDQSPMNMTTIESIVDLVKYLTPPPEEGCVDPHVYQRRREIDGSMLASNLGVEKVVVGQRGLFNEGNPLATEYYEAIKNLGIVSVELHRRFSTEQPNDSNLEIFSVDFDEEGLTLKKTTFVASEEREAEPISFEERTETLDETAARALLEKLQPLDKRREEIEGHLS